MLFGDWIKCGIGMSDKFCSHPFTYYISGKLIAPSPISLWIVLCIKLTTKFRTSVVMVMITFRLLINHVTFAGGNDFPTSQKAFRCSPDVMRFWTICRTGSTLGSSTTCMCDWRIAVWKSGASSDTSHWNLPDSSRVTPRRVTDVASDVVSYIKEDTKNKWIILTLYLVWVKYFKTVIYLYCLSYAIIILFFTLGETRADCTTFKISDTNNNYCMAISDSHT